MSKDCGNPNCPEHGENAESLRQNQARIVSNHELMSIIRMLAANASCEMADKAGVQPMSSLLMAEMIMLGERDNDPFVQGLIKGFTVLLQDHRPTMEYFKLCLDVPEDENYLEKVKREIESRPEPTVIRLSMEDILAMLRGSSK